MSHTYVSSIYRHTYVSSISHVCTCVTHMCIYPHVSHICVVYQSIHMSHTHTHMCRLSMYAHVRRRTKDGATYMDMYTGTLHPWTYQRYIHGHMNINLYGQRHMDISRYIDIYINTYPCVHRHIAQSRAHPHATMRCLPFVGFLKL